MFNGTNPTLIASVDQDPLMFGSREDPYLIDASSPSAYKLRYENR